MPDAVMYVLLTLLSLYYAWRYSIIDIDPDQAMFMFESMGCGRYGKDYIDCKSPAIHIWFWLISKVVGQNITRIRFAHYLLIGMSSMLVYWLTGSFLIALAFLVLINSGWQWAFHGNTGQVPAVLIAVGLASGNESALSLLMLMAVFFEPKLVVAMLAMAVIGVWWWYIPLFVVAVIGTVIVRRFWREEYDWFIEGNITIPRRITKTRYEQRGARAKNLWYTATPLMYITPWLLVAMYNKPDLLYWIPPIIYIAVISLSLQIRAIHFLPITGWIALALSNEVLVFVSVLVITDWVSGGFYWSGIWERFYPALAELNATAKRVGLALKELCGTVWVYDLHSAVYLYAEKPVLYGLAEQIEIRATAHERRVRMVRLLKENAPDYIVTGEFYNIGFVGKGYKLINDLKSMKIFENTSGGTK